MPDLSLTADELLSTTRMVRKRLDLERPVGRDVVRECLELAFQAPSGDNAQSYSWVVVDDPGRRTAMGEIYRDAALEHFAELEASRDGGPPGQIQRLGVELDLDDPSICRSLASAMHLVENIGRVPVLAVPVLTVPLDAATRFEAASMWGSVLPAVWSFMLALRSRGLGSTWTTLHLRQEQRMADLLGLPSGVTQVGLFPVAYTLGVGFRPGRRRPVGDIVRWDRW